MNISSADWLLIYFVIIPILILVAIYVLVRVISSAWHAPTKKVAIDEKPRNPLPNMVFCKWCGVQIPNNSDYCPKCGKDQK